MEYDFYGICDCGWATESPTLSGMKDTASRHLLAYCPKSKEKPRIFINRNFKDSDIDVSFKDVIITREQVVNDYNADVLGSFFSKL